MNEHKIKSGFPLQREMSAQKENKLVGSLQTDNLLTITAFTSKGSSLWYLKIITLNTEENFLLHIS